MNALRVMLCILIMNVVMAAQSSQEAGGNVAETPCQLPSGTSIWRNGLTSTMKISVDASGSVSGYYITAVSRNDCAKNKQEPLVGSCNGYALTFSVNYKGCNSTAAWAGVIDKTKADKPLIRTLWHVATGQAPPTFTSVLAGTDCFVLENNFPQGLADCSLPKK